MLRWGRDVRCLCSLLTFLPLLRGRVTQLLCSADVVGSTQKVLGTLDCAGALLVMFPV